MTVSGSMKMKSGERIQLSVLMPVFRSEVMRMEVTPDEVLLIDRMNKRYVRATRDELQREYCPRMLILTGWRNFCSKLHFRVRKGAHRT